MIRARTPLLSRVAVFCATAVTAGLVGIVPAQASELTATPQSGSQTVSNLALIGDQFRSRVTATDVGKLSPALAALNLAAASSPPVPAIAADYSPLSTAGAYLETLRTAWAQAVPGQALEGVTPDVQQAFDALTSLPDFVSLRARMLSLFIDPLFVQSVTGLFSAPALDSFPPDPFRIVTAIGTIAADGLSYAVKTIANGAVIVGAVAGTVGAAIACGGFGLEGLPGVALAVACGAAALQAGFLDVILTSANNIANDSAAYFNQVVTAANDFANGTIQDFNDTIHACDIYFAATPAPQFGTAPTCPVQVHS